MFWIELCSGTATQSFDLDNPSGRISLTGYFFSWRRSVPTIPKSAAPSWTNIGMSECRRKRSSRGKFWQREVSCRSKLENFNPAALKKDGMDWAIRPLDCIASLSLGAGLDMERIF